MTWVTEDARTGLVVISNTSTSGSSIEHMDSYEELLGSMLCRRIASAKASATRATALQPYAHHNIFIVWVIVRHHILIHAHHQSLQLLRTQLH